MRNLINYGQAAEQLGLARTTLYRWVTEKRIRYVKVGRRTMFDPQDLEAFIEANNRGQPYESIL